MGQESYEIYPAVGVSWFPVHSRLFIDRYHDNVSLACSARLS
jgi:hypothetical protein